MQINPTIEIEDLDGKPIPIPETKAICPYCEKEIPVNMKVNAITVNSNKNITLKTICTNSLMDSYEDEKGLSAEDKLKRGKLAEKIYLATDKIDISVEDVSLIKKLIGKNPRYTPLYIMRSFELLDPVEEKE